MRPQLLPSIIFTFIFATFGVLIGTLWLHTHNIISEPGPTVNEPQQHPVPFIQGWKTHIKEKYGFKFQYPESAILYSPPPRGTLLNETILKFTNEEGDFYNMPVVSFSVYTKDSYHHYVVSHPDRCKIYRHYAQKYSGREADVVEQADCPGDEGSPTGGSGHTLTAIIPLSDTEDLVFDANLANTLMEQSGLADKILSTLTFILSP